MEFTKKYTKTGRKGQRLAVFVVIIIAFSLLLLLSYSYFQAFSQNNHPLLTADTQSYILVDTSFFKENSDVLSYILSYFAESDSAQVKQNLEKLALWNPKYLGYVRDKNEQSTWFAQNPQKNLPDGANEWQRKLIGNNEYVWKNKDFGETRERPSLNDFIVKRSFNNIITNNSTAIKYGTYLGKISSQYDLIRLLLTSDDRVLNMPDASITHKRGTFYLKSEGLGDKLIEQMRKLAGFEGYFIDLVMESPSEIIVYKGDFPDIMQNLYESESEWEINVTVNIDRADLIINAILLDLKEEFPLIEERVLPDDKVIMEVKQDVQQFITLGKSVNLANEQTGEFTFAGGKIFYQYKEGKLHVLKGEGEYYETVDNPCFFQENQAFGYVKNQAHHEGLWKSLFFGLNKERIDICIEGK